MPEETTAGEKAAVALGSDADWTAEDGRTNSSSKYLLLVAHVEALIRGDAHNLLNGRADATARLVVSQLAHVHGLHPPYCRQLFVLCCGFGDRRDAVSGA